MNGTRSTEYWGSWTPQRAEQIPTNFDTLHPIHRQVQDTIRPLLLEPQSVSRDRERASSQLLRLFHVHDHILHSH